MNPYVVLGVSVNASDQEIKRAYRRLVKLYHPDRQLPEASHDQIAAINQAYDILSDPIKRAQYDRGFIEIFVGIPEEDPVEIYKREFKRKRWEREKQEREEKLAHKTQVYYVMRWVNFAIAFFAAGLTLYDLFALYTFFLFHIALFFMAAYVSYQNQYSVFAYKLSFITLYLFGAILLSLLADH